jgi:predicted MFS family arabinose efflux permease
MLSAALERYRDFAREPDVARMVAMAVLSRMPIGMVSLSLLLFVRELKGSFAIAGACVGAYMAAAAALSPAIGRIVDRRGPRVPLIVTGIVCPLALLVVLAARRLDLDTTALIATVAVAGAFAPPITVLTRTMWRYRFEDEALRRIAYAFDSVSIELAFTVGPALVALLIAIATPTMALAAAIVFVALAVPLFFLSPALKYWRHEPYAERHLLGPLTERKLWVVYTATMLLTGSFGLIEVAYPGFATAYGVPALGGILIAVNSIGSAAGGVAYGGLHLDYPMERQLRVLLVLIAIPIALSAIAQSPIPLAVLALIAGFFIAPAFTIIALLVSTSAPSRYATEAFTWQATFIVCGISAGAAGGGVILERFGIGATFLTSALAIVLSAACALALRPQPAKHDGVAVR